MFVIESPRLRPLAARGWYDLLAAKAKRKDWNFMNYGFQPAEGSRLTLSVADEPDRLQIELYEHVLSGVDLSGKRVLEVGSGRGGGASYLARCHGPAHVTGADFAPKAVDLCRRQHAGVANLDFVVGDAERLPFENATFDAVVNVESSHCYGRMESFVDGVIRVLRPGGYFLFADFRSSDEMTALGALLDGRKEWSRIASEDITAGVVAALEASDAMKRKWIEGALASRFHRTAGEVAGLIGGEMHRRFYERERLYYRYAYRMNQGVG